MGASKGERSTIVLRIATPFYKRVKRLAKTTGVSMNEIISLWVREGLKNGAPSSFPDIRKRQIIGAKNAKGNKNAR